MEHFIGMAGLHGCIPQVCDVYDTQDQAAGGLASIHELGARRERELRNSCYLELNLQRDGNEYCEIIHCDCAEPWIHSDNSTRADWECDHDEAAA
jgi:hypothetical protein